MMKTVKKITLIVLMFVSTLSYAEKRREHSHANLITVEFVDAKKGHQLFVKDNNGIILHSEIVDNSGNLSKIFSLKQLEDGNYTVELEKDFEIIIKNFEIKNKVITFTTQQEKKIFKPLVRKAQNRLLMSQMSLDLKPVEVEIYYSDELIYSEKIEDEKTITRIYEFSKPKTGEYRTVIKADDRTYINYFNL